MTLLKKYDFFKNNRKIREQNYKSLAKLMTYKEVKKGEYVYEKGQIPENLYVMLAGQISEEIMNPNIDSWEWARSMYTNLLEWKETVFDPKAKNALHEHHSQQSILKPI